MLVVAGALAATGCAKSVPTSAKIVGLSSNELTVEVKTGPGMRAALNRVERESEAALADEAGVARVVIPRATWTKLGSSIHIDARAESLVGRRFGFTSVDLPVPASCLPRIPEAPGPVWVGLLDAGESYTNSPSTTASVALTDGPEVECGGYWDPEKPLKAVLTAPSGARLELGDGAPVDASSTGLTTVPLSPAALTPYVRTGSLTEDAKHAEVAIPTKVTKDGASKVEPLWLKIRPVHGKPTWMAKPLEAVARGEPFGAKGARVPGVAYLTGWGTDHVLYLGPEGSLGQARWVALEKRTRHHEGPNGELCAQHSYEDVEVTVYEASSGKTVASKRFKAEGVECPIVIHTNRHDTYRPTPATISAWLKTAMGTWK